jgi:hypothetical protein
MLATLGLAAVTGALFAGCGDQLGSAAGTNVLRGGIHYNGGPAPGVDSETNRPGTVRLSRDGHKVAEMTVKEGQPFSFSVQRGTYVLSTNLGDFDCTRDVRVDQPQVRADLECQIK